MIFKYNTLKFNKIKFLIFIFLTLLIQVSAQRQNMRSRSEIGFYGGGIYYIGDLNQSHFTYSQAAEGLFFRFNYNSRIAFKVTALTGTIGASDENASYEVEKNRNLSFSSKIKEFGAGVEFNYFPFQIGNVRYRGTGYLFAEISYFSMDPNTDYNGQKISLRGIGTEGQNTPLSKDTYYSLNQLSIPLGIGFKHPLGNWGCIGIEYGIRKTFTDYLDDVKSNRFINPTAFSAYSNPIGLALSNRNLNKSPYGVRGNPMTKDWYASYGVTFSIRLGQTDKCFKH